jgi:hypothetical protein
MMVVAAAPAEIRRYPMMKHPSRTPDRRFSGTMRRPRTLALSRATLLPAKLDLRGGN